MELSVSVEIEKPHTAVWETISDIKNCAGVISAITKIEVFEEPKDTLIGFKWKETRLMFGKEATEIMWITDYAKNEFYQTRAESHGSVYISRMSIKPGDTGTVLTMSFSGTPQTFFAKLMSGIMGLMFKGSMRKAITKDLNDIKTYVEAE